MAATWSITGFLFVLFCFFTFFALIGNDSSWDGTTQVLTLTICDDGIREPQQVGIVFHVVVIAPQFLLCCLFLDESTDQTLKKMIIDK